MAITDSVRERPAAGHHDRSGTGIPAGKTVLDDAADRAARLAWLWPALLTLVLGLYQMGRPELWRDELASWTFATRPVPGLIAAGRRSGATQLAYYLVLHAWIMAFGDSADAMRTLSVLAMAAAAACVALAGRRLAGPRAGLISGLVFALVPSVSRFAQEVRFYALEVLVATLATLLLLRALDRPSARRWVAYGSCLALLGYVDIVGLSVVAGHAGGVALRWWRDRDRDAGLLWFIPAALIGVAACLPLVVVGTVQAGGQIEWVARPGMDVGTFSFFARNLFYSTSVAAALIVVAVLAWALAWPEAAFMTAIAILPVAAVWLVSQGPHSYFFPRYLLLTVAAWTVLAGIWLSRVDARIVLAVLALLAVFAAGDQRVVREPGAHSWAMYPAGTGGYYPGYADAADVIAGRERPGDGVIYQGDGTRAAWMMIGYGVQYYLGRDLRPGVPAPHQLFIAETAAKAGVLYPRPCQRPAACLGHEPRIWVVGFGHGKSPFRAVTRAEAALLRRHYRPGYVRHVPGLTVFLLVRA